MYGLLQEDLITGVRFAGAFDMLVMALLLAFIYRGRVQSKVYNHSRWLLVVGMFVLALHNSIQFVGHFRETNVCLCWLINLLGYSFVGSCMALAEVNLLRAGRKLRNVTLLNMAGLFAMAVLALVGWGTDTLINNDAPWRTTTCVMALVYSLMLIVNNIWVMRDLRHVNTVMSDDELQERRRVLRYTAKSMFCIMLATLLSPWVGMSSSLIAQVVLGMVVFALIIWYLVEFLFYGHDMSEVIEVEDEILRAGVLESDKLESVPTGYVEPAIVNWLAEKHYTNPNLTIEDTLIALQISPSALNYYIQNTYNLPGYRQWISHLRVEEAKRLMITHHGFSLEAIAEQCGVSNGSALARSFRANTGMSPTQWMMTIRKK